MNTSLDHDPTQIASSTNASFTAAIRRSDEIWGDINAGKTDKYRILTGDRTTGALHIGHYFGTLKNRVALQDLGVNTTLVLADFQALTDREADDRISISVKDIILDYLAAGIDPNKTLFFTHSAVASLNELMLPFLGLVSVPELQRNPTVKEEIAASGGRSVSGMMLTYPVHQAADILFCKANLVPVGKDQLPHLEMSRTIAKRMNQQYFSTDYFPEPDALFSTTPLLLGTDGQKMSKSKGNAIMLKHSPEQTAKILKGAKTDSERFITYDPVNRPEVANLLNLLSLVTDRTPQQWADDISNGGSGTLKKYLTEALNDYLCPLRTRRIQWEDNLDEAIALLQQGNERANEIGEKTLQDVKEAMGLIYY